MMPKATATPVPPAPTATPEPPKAMFMTPDELIPDGLEEAHPLIYQYHWSRLAPPAAGPPDTGGTLRLSISFEPNNWSSLEGNFGTLIYGTLVYNGLVRADMRLSEALKGNDNLRALVVACDLCESFEVRSPSEYVFNLREGAQWHQTSPLNGRPVTAADVKQAYDRYLDTGALRQYGQFQTVESIEAPDDSTVVINLKFPRSGFLEAITAPAFMILPPEAFDREGGAAVEPPLGSGSFALKEHQRGARLVFESNPNYFKTDEFGIQIPYLDQIEVTALDATARSAAWRTGNLDQTLALNNATVTSLLQEETVPDTANLRIEEANTAGASFFQMQLREPPFDDVRVRRALSMAIDRELMIELAHQVGYCQPQAIPTWWQGLDYPPACGEAAWTEYSPDTARGLLAQAGFGPDNPLEFTLTGHGTGGEINPRFIAMFEVAQQSWEDIGVKVNIVTIERTLLESQLRSREFTGMIGGTGVGGGNDLDSYAQKVRSDGPENFSGINDAEIDRLVDLQQRSVDQAERRAAATALAQRLDDQVYLLALTSGYFGEFTRPYIQNWATHALYLWMHGFGSHAMENTWILESAR